MPTRGRWDRCIEHRGAEVEAFIRDYFAQPDRRCLLIAGAGFDPRSPELAGLLGSTLGDHIVALLLKEERPHSPAALVDRATENLKRLRGAVASAKVVQFDVFEIDNAIVGGRNVVKALNTAGSFDAITDVVIDLSALSIGTSFPVVRYAREHTLRAAGRVNLHVMVVADSDLDAAIVPIASDSAGYVHGFRGQVGLDSHARAAKLWLPQLAEGQRMALQRIRQVVDPHDTCPILPFPALHPRAGDRLLEHYLTEIESAWEVDSRNVIYAAENNPLDLYRTILRIDDVRNAVFRECGGSLLILSPVGSKILALGALLAALERDMPVAYIESVGYECHWPPGGLRATPEILHLWLEGSVYPDGGTRGEV